MSRPLTSSSTTHNDSAYPVRWYKRVNFTAIRCTDPNTIEVKALSTTPCDDVRMTDDPVSHNTLRLEMNATEAGAVWYNHPGLRNDVQRAVESAAWDPLSAPAFDSTEWHTAMHAVAHSAVTRHFAERYGFPESLNGLTPEHVPLSFQELRAVEARLGLIQESGPGDSDAHLTDELPIGAPLGDSTSMLLTDPSALCPAVRLRLSHLAGLTMSGTPPSEAGESVPDARGPPSEAEAPTGRNSPDSQDQAVNLSETSGSHPQAPASEDSLQLAERYHPSAAEIEGALRVVLSSAFALPRWNPSESPSSGEEAGVQ